MVVITVVAGVMIYAWVSGFIQTGVPSTPKSYIVSVDLVTSDSVATNSTMLKVKITNPGAKQISVSAANFIVTNSSGTTYDSTTSPVRVYRVIPSNGTAARVRHNTNPMNITASTYSVNLAAGSTTTMLVELVGQDVTAATTGALKKGNTYLFNTQDATTFDGISVTSAESTFKATK